MTLSNQLLQIHRRGSSKWRFIVIARSPEGHLGKSLLVPRILSVHNLPEIEESSLNFGSHNLEQFNFQKKMWNWPKKKKKNFTQSIPPFDTCFWSAVVSSSLPFIKSEREIYLGGDNGSYRGSNHDPKLRADDMSWGIGLMTVQK